MSVLVLQNGGEGEHLVGHEIAQGVARDGVGAAEFGHLIRSLRHTAVDSGPDHSRGKRARPWLGRLP